MNKLAKAIPDTYIAGTPELILYLNIVLYSYLTRTFLTYQYIVNQMIHM